MVRITGLEPVCPAALASKASVSAIPPYPHIGKGYRLAQYPRIFSPAHSLFILNPYLVWIAGFEPAASRFQAGYATKLRYIQIGSGSRTRTYDTGFKAQWLTTCRPPNITTILPVLRRG